MSNETNKPNNTAPSTENKPTTMESTTTTGDGSEGDGVIFWPKKKQPGSDR